MAEAPRPEVPKSNLAVTRITKESAAPRVSPYRDVPLQNVVVESGCRQRQIYRDNGTFFRKLSATPILPTDLDSMEKNRFDSETSQRKRSSGQVYEESKSSGVIDRKPEKPIGTDVIVSNTDVSNNSVTVSVIYPERTAEPLSRNQTKRKREGDMSLDRFSFQSSLMPGERI
ncbi:hypothetical protein DMN91_010563 [Ooceraea biroi]|uniref:Uncharacterized protein n=1 Tax=Ooceraea biroi TaxID=2015173 RepID=A0A3L8D7P6_OOCBI|nr:hypothetical protein DMN91_010563 [Ooceraea biroi]